MVDEMYVIGAHRLNRVFFNIRENVSYFTKNPAEFYVYAIHFLYTLLLTSTFEIARDVFIPIGEVNTFSEWINTFALFFIYFLLISGWIGYTRSVSKRPHTNTSWGTLRFVIDILIILTTFYLTALADPDTFENNFSEAFIGILPGIFLLYIFWDCIRYIEYSKIEVSSSTAEYKYDSEDEKSKDLKILYGRLLTTFTFLLISVSQIFVFLYLDDLLAFLFNLKGPQNMYESYGILISFYVVIFAAYRYIKWNPPSIRVYHAS